MTPLSTCSRHSGSVSVKNSLLVEKATLAGYKTSYRAARRYAARRSRRISVRARTHPQPAQLWWPAGQLWRNWPAGTDRQTDGRIAAPLNASPTAGP